MTSASRDDWKNLSDETFTDGDYTINSASGYMMNVRIDGRIILVDGYEYEATRCEPGTFEFDEAVRDLILDRATDYNYLTSKKNR